MFLQKFNKSGLLCKKMSMNKPKNDIILQLCIEIDISFNGTLFYIKFHIKLSIFTTPHHISSLSVVL